MLTFKYIQENPEAVIAELKIKNFNAEPYIKQILAKDDLVVTPKRNRTTFWLKSILFRNK